jgi:hypothetical protein
VSQLPRALDETSATRRINAARAGFERGVEVGDQRGRGRDDR